MLLTKRDICAGAQSLGIELLLSSVAALVDPAKWQGSSSGDGLWCCWVASQAGTLHWGLFSLSGPLNSPRSQLPKLHCSFNKGTKYAPQTHFKRWAVRGPDMQVGPERGPEWQGRCRLALGRPTADDRVHTKTSTTEAGPSSPLPNAASHFGPISAPPHIPSLSTHNSKLWPGLVGGFYEQRRCSSAAALLALLASHCITRRCAGWHRHWRRCGLMPFCLHSSATTLVGLQPHTHQHPPATDTRSLSPLSASSLFFLLFLPTYYSQVVTY